MWTGPIVLAAFPVLGTLTEALARSPFLCPDAGGAEPTVTYSVADEVRHWSGAPVHADLQRRLAIHALLSAPLEGEVFAGRLLVLDTSQMSSDDLALASAVAHYVAAGIDRAYLVQQLQDAAAMQERARMAHALHDGVLQSLTGIELTLERLKAHLGQPEALRERLDEVRQIVADEHTELRAFLRAFLRALPRPAGAPAGDFEFGRRLEKLLGRVSRQWDIAVKLAADRLPAFTPKLARHVYLIVREVVLNAARHAGASLITIEAVGEAGALRLVVADDGRGFGFDGRREKSPGLTGSAPG